MGWNEYIWFAVPTIFFLVLSAICVIKLRTRLTNIFTVIGIIIYFTFILSLWLDLGYPPFQTIGEIRLWFSLFILIFAILIYNRWKSPLPLLISFLASGVFIIINITNVEIQVTALNPILQSHWYVPHVISYIISYSLLASSTIGAIVLLLRKKSKLLNKEAYQSIDVGVYIGFILLLIGLLLGVLWAYEAWGEFWAWDPKETWALITSLVYMIYIHIRLKDHNSALPLWLLILAFLILMFTWIGIKYLPTSKNSLHVY